MSLPSPRTLLIVDDSAAVRMVLKQHLHDRGFNVVEAENAQHALERLKYWKVDLVITDVNMPGMNGIALLEHLRQAPKAELRTLPVFLLTGDHFIETDRCLKAGAAGFLRKPVAQQELVTRVEEHFAGAHDAAK
ncbi:MAG TPA: response regulator [Myxococcaceae bacterium]|nr:response regulator [Myxococcaceae bacterium]